MKYEVRQRFAQRQARAATLRRRLRVLVGTAVVLITGAMAAPAVAPTVFKVRTGDTFSGIVGKLTGKAWDWNRLYDPQRSQLADPNFIVPGMRFQLVTEADGSRYLRAATAEQLAAAKPQQGKTSPVAKAPVPLAPAQAMASPVVAATTTAVKPTDAGQATKALASAVAPLPKPVISLPPPVLVTGPPTVATSVPTGVPGITATKLAPAVTAAAPQNLMTPAPGPAAVVPAAGSVAPATVPTTVPVPLPASLSTATVVAPVATGAVAPAPAPAPAPAAVAPVVIPLAAGGDTLVIAVMPSISASVSVGVLATQYDKLKTYLERSTSQKVRVVVPVSMKAYFEATMRGEYDLAIGGPHFARLAQVDARWVPVAMFEPRTNAQFITLLDGPMKSPRDLRGKAVVFANPQSLVSMYGRQWLGQQGLEPGKDYDIKSARTDLGVGRMMLSGDAVAAVMSSGEFRALPADEAARLKIVEVIARIPNFVVMAHPRLGTERVARLKTKLQTFLADSGEGQAFAKATGISGIVDADEAVLRELDAFVAPTRRMMVPAP
jgi:phosphonate transport system substrate-binding protein